MVGGADIVARGPSDSSHASSAPVAINFNRRWVIFNWVLAMINGMASAASDNEARDVEPNVGSVASGGPSSPATDNFNRR
ncbi:hypothetical protein NL676_026755 [Syzygium grande]|nr:hypothetical protein NL676_026755 [Syzygium grande]